MWGAALVTFNFREVNLEHANLWGADLGGVVLLEAIARRANLRGADLQEANLQEADLRGAKVTDEQLANTRSLQGATMPNGQKYEDWHKSQGSEEDRENSSTS